MKGVVITGVSQGLGKAFFDFFSVRNYLVVGISRSFTNEQLQLQAAQPSKVILLKIDLSSLGENDLECLDKAIKGIAIDDMLFLNNASVIDPIGQVGNLSDVEISNSAMVNFVSPIKLLNYFIGNHTRYKKLSIINISSGAAVRAINGWAMYCSVKAGLSMFIEVLKLQYAGNQNMVIENVDPGVINTRMQATIRAVSDDSFPDVEKFRGFERNDQLQSAEEAAQKILAKLTGL